MDNKDRIFVAVLIIIVLVAIVYAQRNNILRLVGMNGENGQGAGLDCRAANALLPDGAECTTCIVEGSLAPVRTGIIVSGSCELLPASFTGRNCSFPSDGTTTNYRIELTAKGQARYIKQVVMPEFSIFRQMQSAMDQEISRGEYVSAYLDSLSTCPLV